MVGRKGKREESVEKRRPGGWMVAPVMSGASHWAHIELDPDLCL